MTVQKRSGLTLIEVLFVLGIMAILIGLVMLLYSYNTNRNEAVEFKQEIIMSLDIAQQFRESNLHFDENQIAVLMPEKYKHSISSSAQFGMYSPWGGPINFYTASYASSDYIFGAQSIPYGICSQLQGTSFDDLKPYGETSYSLSCNKKGIGYLLIYFTF